MSLDPYSVLGLPQSAPLDDIKKAYRRLSKELHPDRHKGNKEAEKRFKQVNEAYEVLSDPQKKATYDRFGHTGGPGGGFGGGMPFEGFSAEGFKDIRDIFEQFFGGEKHSSSRGQGDDHHAEIEISFMDSAEGVDKIIKLHRIVSCGECGGSGGARDAEIVACKMCGGTGQTRRTARSFFGMIEQHVLCDHCRGSGRVPNVLCSDCRGEGRRRKSPEEMVRIPAGIADGQTIRISGKGDAGWRGGEPGDLFVTVRVLPDKRFMRDGDDVRSMVRVSLIVALLGGECPVDTVHGVETLKIPAGTQSHQVFRLRGKGMPIVGTARNGDHYVTVVVDIPTKLSCREREIIEEWHSLA